MGRTIPNSRGNPATLEEVRADWQDEPVNAREEVTELVALCLWDVFSNNHDVIAADGRVADIGSFRGAARFLVEYLTGSNDDLWNMDYCRFYMGTIWISDRADLTPVYAMIFHRLKTLGADWEFHFPQLGIVDLSPLRKALEKQKPEEYSPSEAFGNEQKERKRQAELERFRAELAEGSAQARRDAMDYPPPATVPTLIKQFMAATRKAGHQCSGGRRLFSRYPDRRDALSYFIDVHQCPSVVLSSLCSFAAKEFVLIRVHWWFSDFALLRRDGVQFADFWAGLV